MLMTMNFLNSCKSSCYSADCKVKLIRSHLLSGNQTEILKIKKNNVYLCEKCPNHRDKIDCEKNRKEYKKIKKRQRKRTYWIF